MSYYSVNLPSYTIGEGCYKEIPHTTRFYGKTAVVIGGKIAMSKAKDKILEGIKDSDVEILDFKHFVKHTVFNLDGDKFRNKEIKNYVVVKVVIDMVCGDTKKP